MAAPLLRPVRLAVPLVAARLLLLVAAIPHEGAVHSHARHADAYHPHAKDAAHHTLLPIVPLLVDLPPPPPPPIPPLPPPSAKTAYKGFTYHGCFVDDAERDISVRVPYGYTIADCDAACAAYGYTIFAMQWGHECRCGDSFSSPLKQYPRIDDAFCISNSSVGGCALCGTKWANAVYSTTVTSDFYTYHGCFRDTFPQRDMIL